MHAFYFLLKELLMMTTFLPMWPKFCRGELSQEMMLSDNECALKMYDKEYLDELLQIIPNYLHLGYLDI